MERRTDRVDVRAHYARAGIRHILRLRRDGPPRVALLLGAVCVLAAMTTAALAFVVATGTAATVPTGLTFVRTGAHSTRYEA